MSANQRFLVFEDSGEPFFWLGDTAWELFHRLNRDEADRYLRDRAEKGFTVKVRMDKISGSKATAWWYDPRTGAADRIATAMNTLQSQRCFMALHCRFHLKFVDMLPGQLELRSAGCETAPQAPRERRPTSANKVHGKP